MRSQGLYFLLYSLLPLLMLSCSHVPGAELRGESSFGPPTIYYCPEVTKSPLHIAITPPKKIYEQVTVFLLPIIIHQEIKNRNALGKELGKELWAALLEERLFSTITYQPDLADNIPRALEQAKKTKTALVIVPTSNYFFSSGSQGRFSLNLHLEIYDTASKAMIWSSTQNGELNCPFYQDHILFKTSPRMPVSPARQTIGSLAHDFAQALQSWLQPTHKS